MSKNHKETGELIIALLNDLVAKYDIVKKEIYDAQRTGEEKQSKIVKEYFAPTTKTSKK